MLKRYTGGEWVEQGGGGGTNDYADLSNKPKINNTTLSGNKTSSDLGLQPAINGSAKVNADYIDDSTSTNKFVTAADKTNWNAKLGPGDTYTKQELDYEFTEIDNAIDAVKAGADAGATALQPEDVASTYSSSGTEPINGTGVAAALSTLDVPAVGGSGKYISQISEVDGKIVPVVQTMDSTPTEESYKAISSDGVWADQQRQEIEMGDIVNRGSKNFAVPFDPISTSDIIVTRNADGSYTFACTNVSENRVIRVANIGDMPSGEFKISGVTGGSSSTYMLGLYNTSSTAVKYQHTNPEESYTGDVSGFSLRVRVISGYSGTFTVYPMIRPASITDSTFVPYALANPVITPALIEQVDNGAKNLFDIQHPSTIRDTSYNVTSDGGIELSCTNATWTQYRVANTPVESGREYAFTLYVDAISGTNTFRVYIRDNNESGNMLYDSSNISTVTTLTTIITPNANNIWVSIYLNNSATAKTASAKIRAMLCTKSVWDISHKYEPYALPNPTLTPAAIKAVDEGAKNHLDLHAIAKTESNVTFVINSDKTISVTTNGAASAQVSTKLLGNAGNYVPNIYGGLLISGVPNPDKGTAFYVAYSNNGTSQVAATTLRAGETTIIDGTYPYIQIFIIVYSGSNVGSTPVVFKPMICTAADWAISQKFVPYAMNNAELTAEVKNITPTIIKDQSTSVGTSYTLISSLTQTTTAGKLCKISTIIAYRNYRPRGIVLSYSNDSSNFDTGDKLIAKTENTGDIYELSASAIISRNNVPVYVWAKAATAGAERIYSIMEQLGDL